MLNQMQRLAVTAL